MSGARSGSRPSVGSRAAVHTSSAIRTSFSLAQKRTISSMFGRSSELPVGLPGLITTSARGCTPFAFAPATAFSTCSIGSAHASASSSSYPSMCESARASAAE